MLSSHPFAFQCPALVIAARWIKGKVCAQIIYFFSRRRCKDPLSFSFLCTKASLLLLLLLLLLRYLRTCIKCDSGEFRFRVQALHFQARRFQPDCLYLHQHFSPNIVHTLFMMMAEAQQYGRRQSCFTM